jgi:predicted amidohydrolase YtcJ
VTARADLVVRGRIIVAALPSGLETVDAIAIADGRIIATGRWDEVQALTGPRAQMVEAGDRAVIPGLHDFHLHLVALARASEVLTLDDARDAAEIAERLARAASASDPSTWITGRGWSESQLAGGTAPLDAAVGDRPAFLSSHDGHSAWASAAALRRAGVDASTPDPPGGRIERRPAGEPTGVLRETALELVAHHVTRPQGQDLRRPLDVTLGQLASLGITGATEAGDYTLENGVGADAVFGDSYSSLSDLADLIDGRLRLTLGIPADGIELARDRGLRTGMPLEGRRTMRFGWAKEYADGALGSGTAALLQPRTCGERDTGILRVEPEELDWRFSAARRAGIGMAVHAIGDRAARQVLYAVARAAPRRSGTPDDRLEHAQLVSAEDVDRFGPLGITASIQPIHAASDRDLVEECWDGRQDDAYAWRHLASAGARLAAGSDAPVESVNPWLGIFAAVNRHHPADGRGPWRPAQALTAMEALSAYTLGPALALGVTDEGHLRPGARADLAVLSIGIDELLEAGEALTGARSTLTLVNGREVPQTSVGG